MLKKIIKNIVNQAGYTVYKETENPHDAYVQQSKLFAGRNAMTIFDVGANVGQTVARYKGIFPDSTIYAFEPHPQAYAQLAAYTRQMEKVHPFEMALDNRDGAADFFLNTYSETSSLMETTTMSKEIWGEGAMTPAGSIQVKVSTLDSFVAAHAVPVIDILKLDTQGTEYKIIEGAARTLAAGKVKAIYTEVITLPTYSQQKEIHQIMEMLHAHSFRLYGIYNHSYSTGKLSSVDALFLHDGF
jgi:FkbM family methyltransferase